MTTTRRPRVAAIGLDDPQIEAIKPLCGELRAADSSSSYLQNYSWTETDVLVASTVLNEIDNSVNLITIGPTLAFWWEPSADLSRARCQVRTNSPNTERELTVPPSCPDLYKPLAVELSKQLDRAEEPPGVITCTQSQGNTALIETTSGQPVALRLMFPTLSGAGEREPSRAIALLLPGNSNLVAWFRAFSATSTSPILFGYHRCHLV